MRSITPSTVAYGRGLRRPVAGGVYPDFIEFAVARRRTFVNPAAATSQGHTEKIMQTMDARVTDRRNRQPLPPDVRRRWHRASFAISIVLAILLTSAGTALATRPGTPTTQAACEAAGGEWKAAGLQGHEQCDVRTADAGAPCREDSDCQSVCITDDAVAFGTATVGRCFERSVSIGRCMNRVTGGVATGVVCAD